MRDPSKNWYNSFFFVKNEWGLREKWDRLKDLPSSSYVGEEDILRILNFLDMKSLQQELCYISRYVTEECLFKVGLFTQAGRSHAIQLKKSEKVHETTSNVLKRSASHPSKGQKIQSHIQEAYEKLFDVEVKDLECQSLKEGFTRGFLKDVWLVHRKTNVEIEGLTLNQASDDSSPDSGDEDIKSELNKTLLFTSQVKPSCGKLADDDPLATLALNLCKAHSRRSGAYQIADSTRKSYMDSQ
ncbi:hypothetical protein IEQ34_011666 [Dendrobium chrysotoxum]|uniref:Uncharacterized protein n=1 Tax=Dendrobium chrysotoxum TaxID=161865 RepID=A0AAV7GTI6_DENCH|nr:hypothetical protein IEQ34_011666 [Dendrobium chrysotoxum]